MRFPVYRKGGTSLRQTGAEESALLALPLACGAMVAEKPALHFPGRPASWRLSAGPVGATFEDVWLRYLSTIINIPNGRVWGSRL